MPDVNDEEDVSQCSVQTTPADAPAYLTLSADSEPMRLESLCMDCGKNGITTLMMTRIPFFREVVLMAFECEHCGFRNSELQLGGLIPEKGVRYELSVAAGEIKSLSRQIVKGDHATITIPELDFEIPPNTQKGIMTTVEGIFSGAATNLRALQVERREADPALAGEVDRFCTKLDSCAAAERPFTLILDDPSGNSAVEWFGDWGDGADSGLKREFYERTPDQNVAIGCMSDEQAVTENARIATEKAAGETLMASVKQRQPGYGAPKLGSTIAKQQGLDVMAALGRYSAPEEVMVFEGHCPLCRASADTRMFATNIPYFKQVIVMCTSCDSCGYRTNDLKPGGEIPAKGTKIVLQVRGPKDIRRDIIKSESADVEIPELELILTRGTLGGRVTTVEGLLTEVRDQLKRTFFSSLGDSAEDRVKSKWDDFYERLEKCMSAETPFTLVLRDPLAGCFIAPATDNPNEDDQLEITEFERNWEEDDEFGMHDINVDHYAEPGKGSAEIASVGPVEKEHVIGEKAGAEGQGCAGPTEGS